MTPDIAWAWPWWSAMVALNIINLIVCLTIFRRITRSAGGFSNITDQYQKNMLVLGLIFTCLLYTSDAAADRSGGDRGGGRGG